FKSGQRDAPIAGMWHSQVDGTNTTIWAQFIGLNPNEQFVEINARQTIFYPEKPGMNYITIRGFVLQHAATNWAPPTEEQFGLIGTNWSKGWIIENNAISYSTCSGIALGKYHDKQDPGIYPGGNTVEVYVNVIQRALKHGWNKETVGHHVVRNNRISHCEQAGIVGSLGGVFSVISGNTIHDIYTRRMFAGPEIAGIKLHGAIDVVIRGNHIYRSGRGLWLDWMAQGTRVSGNLFHDNDADDLFIEVSHGPFLVDNNLLLSGVGLRDVSEGGAYVHNLLAGAIVAAPELTRNTPYHQPHATAFAGRSFVKGGDDRFYNNLFVAAAGNPQTADDFTRWGYDAKRFPLQTGGNAFCSNVRLFYEQGSQLGPLVPTGVDPATELSCEGRNVYLRLTLGPAVQQAHTTLVTTPMLGKAKISGLPYENADGTPLRIDTDYFGNPRNDAHPTPGPFENPGTGPLTLKVW
ncbi:MAG: right-handed parallel beta-helix repeat-containing protein, partial [Thermoguttaceae bacterium]